MYTGFSWAGKKGLPSRYYLVVKIQPFQKDRTGWSFFMLVAQFRIVSWMNEFWKTAISCMNIVGEFWFSPPIKTDWVECCIIMTSQIPTHHRHCHSVRSLSGDDGIMVITVDLIILLGGIINYEMATKLFAFFGWLGRGRFVTLVSWYNNYPGTYPLGGVGWIAPAATRDAAAAAAAESLICCNLEMLIPYHTSYEN